MPSPANRAPRCVKAYLTFPQEREQLPSLNKIHNHIQILTIRERAPQRNQERMLTPLQHPSLIIRVLDLLHLHHLLLLQHLDRIVPLIMLRLHQMYPAKRPRAESPLEREVVERILPLRLSYRVRCRLSRLCGSGEQRWRILRVAGAGCPAAVGAIMLTITSAIIRLMDQVLDAGHILRVGVGVDALHPASSRRALAGSNARIGLCRRTTGVVWLAGEG